MRRTLTATAAAALLTLTLGACSNSPSAPPAPPESPTTTESPESPSAEAEPSTGALPPDFDVDDFDPPPEGVIDELTGEVYEKKSVPTWDDASRESAVRAGEIAMNAFAKPKLEYDAWWAQLAPLMSYEAQFTYAMVDPANVPASKVTQRGHLIEEGTAYLARVAVPTDAGTYTVLLSREDAESPWLAERFDPPADDTVD